MTFTRLAHAKRVVVVAPHSDDETIAAYSLIGRSNRLGAEVSVIVVTDGAASHRNSPTWPKSRLIAERRKETLRAMRTVGVTQDKVRFLAFPDGGLDSLTNRERIRLARELARGPEPDIIVIPDLRDAHPDHRDVAVACAHAWPRRVQRLSYIVWKDRNAPRAPAAANVTFKANGWRKRRALRLYRTQTGLIEDDPDGFHLSDRQITLLCGPNEQFIRGW